MEQGIPLGTGRQRYPELLLSVCSRFVILFRRQFLVEDDIWLSLSDTFMHRGTRARRNHPMTIGKLRNSRQLADEIDRWMTGQLAADLSPSPWPARMVRRRVDSVSSPEPSSIVRVFTRSRRAVRMGSRLTLQSVCQAMALQLNDLTKSPVCSVEVVLCTRPTPQKR